MAYLRRAQTLILSRSLTAAATTTVPSTFPSFRAAKSALLSTSDPDTLADLFITQSSSFPRFVRHRPLYSLLLRRLSPHPHLVHRVLHHQISSPPPLPVSLTEGFFLRIIGLYSDSRLVDRAIETLDDFIRRDDIVKTEKSFCAILTALLKNRKFDRFRGVFDTYHEKMGVSRGVKSYNLALKAYCEEGKVEAAVDLIGRMEKEGGGVKPDIDSFNVVLKGYLKRKDWAGFDRTVKDVNARGLEGNVRTYKYRIERLCGDKECARARKLLDEMVAKGMKPNVGCYNGIIEGFCRVGDLDSAKGILERMDREGYVVPCSVPYNVLLRQMVEEGDYGSGLEVCREILKRKWEPPFKVMEGLVKGLVGMSKLEEAKEIIEKMKRTLKGPAADSWGKIEAALPL